MLNNGQVLNSRYEVEKLIARGGMGAVYKVRDLKLNGKALALKVIRNERLNGELFHGEVRMLAG